MLRKAFGAKREAVVRGWRKLNSEELHDLYTTKNTVFARVICALFFSILAAEKSGCVKYADFFFCGGLDLGFILV